MKDELIKKILQLVESAENFTITNAPLYAKELLEYSAWKYSILIHWGWVPVIVFFILAIIFFTLMKEEIADFFLVLWGFSIVIWLMVVPYSYFSLKKIEKAPRVFLIEELKR